MFPSVTFNFFQSHCHILTSRYPALQFLRCIHHHLWHVLCDSSRRGCGSRIATILWRIENEVYLFRVSHVWVRNRGWNFGICPWGWNWPLLQFRKETLHSLCAVIWRQIDNMPTARKFQLGNQISDVWLCDWCTICQTLLFGLLTFRGERSSSEPGWVQRSPDCLSCWRNEEKPLFSIQWARMLLGKMIAAFGGNTSSLQMWCLPCSWTRYWHHWL